MSEPACGSCARALISQSVWYRADLEQRAAWSRDGRRLAKGHGLCVNCYTVARRHNALPKPNVAPPLSLPLVPCSRCGVKETPGLCSDCRDVVADLDRGNEAEEEEIQWVRRGGILVRSGGDAT